jgi:hypothetical protein
MMKNILLIALLMPALCLPARATCRYFRSTIEVEQCKEVNPAEVQNFDPDGTEIPELSQIPRGKLMRVRCGCEYKLSGANLFCDLEQSQDLQSVMGTDEDAQPCSTAKAFCDSLCPKTFTPS